jgi:hypothetical protein
VVASPDALPLDLHEGVALGYALVARLAADRAVPILGLKGPTLEKLGLRPPRQSLDVDVLVDPARFDDLLSALVETGWSRPPAGGPGGHVIPTHSVPLSHPSWPLEIDVHHYFPGFLAAADTVFDALWRGRTEVELAGQSVPVPSRPGAAAVALLHLLRGGERRADELDLLLAHLDTSLTAVEREALVDLVVITGAAGPLKPALAHLGLAAGATEPVDPDAEATWALVHESGGAHTVGWLVSFRQSPIRCWPALLWRALWLTEAELRIRYPSARPGWLGLLEMWLDRWWTGLRELPRAVLLLRDHRPDSGAPRRGRTGR